MPKLPQQIDSLSPTANTNHYIKAVQRIPILTQAEELVLSRQYQEQGDLEAARKLTLSHLRFVVYVARGYSGYNLPLGDVIQEGNIGLMQGIKKFNPDAGVRVSTYVVYWIKSSIHEFIFKNWKIVKVANTKHQRKLFFKLKSLKPKHDSWLTKEEAVSISKTLDVPLEQVYEMEKRLSYKDTPLEFHDSDEDDFHQNISSPIHMLTDQRDNPEEQVLAAQSRDYAKDQLAHALKCLDKRSRDILKKRWLHKDKSTLQELADSHNITAERVRQLEKEAMGKIKKILKNDAPH